MSGLIVFDIKDFWHAGAGHGAGRFLDATVRRTPAGLPILPGRTVKGLFRDALQQAEKFGHQPAGMTETLFGTALSESRFKTEAGALQFGNAELPGDWESYAATEEGKKLIPGLYDDLASTAIAENGQAVEGSLRRIEVAIPLALEATWQLAPGTAISASEAQDALATAAGLIRRLGVSRTRGLGRVHVYLKEQRS